jgi:hypothetical protein
MRMRYFALVILGCVFISGGFLMLFCPAPEIKLRTIIVEFLRTTDVSKFLMDGTVIIKEVYDNIYGGDIVVVEYVTSSMGHPTFMLEAIERHIAVTSLDANRKVVSAFCIHGTGVWDLVNQKWLRP